MKSIKDLVYLDFEKARSLISQLKGGLISEISRAFEDENESEAGIGFDLKVIKGNIGGKDREKSIRTEKIEVYHELLNEIERELSSHNLLSDLNHTWETGKVSFNEFLKTVPEFKYIKATGWSQFEDFERFKKIYTNFNEIQRLIFGAQMSESPEIKGIQDQIKDAKKAASKMEKNAKAKEFAKIASLEKKFDGILQSGSQIHIIDEVFIERVKLMLDTFSPQRLNFRLLPIDPFNNFQILANLKEKYIIDGSMENIIYTYGSRPNVKLSVVGIVTSCPPEKDIRVNMNDEYLGYNENELTDTQGFEMAFRNVFSSFEAFENFFFVPTYPKIAITPIAIYRELTAKI